jgi:hypothetical protein
MWSQGVLGFRDKLNCGERQKALALCQCMGKEGMD